MFVYSIQRGIELGLLDKSEYGPVASRGYRALLTFARVNEHGLVDLDGGADGVCIMRRKCSGEKRLLTRLAKT